MNSNLEKFKDVLKEIFQMDQAELDFGIYRIMNQKRAEIEQFLDNELLPQVTNALSEISGNEAADIKAEIDEMTKNIINLGYNPDENLQLMELKEKLAIYGNTESMENDIFSHLTNFFKRYYDNGDFISQRRYKKDVYAIPYEGEEVKLYWANYDQYYIKTTEYFNNYSFKLENGNKVNFVIKKATTEQNNNIATGKKERRFFIVAEDPVTVDENILSINFNYDFNDEKQKDLNIKSFEVVKKYLNDNPTQLINFKGVFDLRPTEKNSQRTLLEKHINDFTARNTFDYFIHKDLGGFLRRELDYYIKNEVLFIDDINELDEKQLQKQVSMIKVLKQIGHKIIAFLEQLENFQKKLWLKKKFVIETNYCITLDRVPKELYAQIINNEKQIEEWVKLFAIDDIKGDLWHDGFANPLTEKFLEENQLLVLDTKFFDEDFKLKLLKSINNVDEQTDGLLIHSENFQALNLLQKRYKEQVKCIYIDPPYNTKGDGFVYKDYFQHSSWLALLNNRVYLSQNMLLPNGTFAISIDSKELSSCLSMLDSIFGENNRRNIISVKRSAISGPKVINPGVVNISEFVLLYSNSMEWSYNKVIREREFDSRYNLFIENPNENCKDWRFSSVMDNFSKYIGIPKSQLKKKLGSTFNDKFMKFIFNNIDSIARFVNIDETSVSSEATDLKRVSLKNPNEVFHLTRNNKYDYFIMNGKLILFYKHRLIEVNGKLVPGEPISDIWDDVLPNDLHNEGGVNLRKGKKPEKLIQRVINIGTNDNDYVLDYFAGSGTTLSVCLKEKRKVICVESGEYFRDITLKRAKNTLYGEKSGISKDKKWGGSGLIKYIKLESYEDTLNNLEVKNDKLQLDEINFEPEFKESYMLNYMLDVETAGSNSLLNISKFVDPFNYYLKITTDNEIKPQKIDLVETFNYLIGIIVDSHEEMDGYRVIIGKNLEGKKILIIWRNLNEKSNEELNKFFEKIRVKIKDSEYDEIYVNGENYLENMKLEEDNWKVKLIEEEFKIRMFE